MEELTEIANKYKTDKGTHFFDKYEGGGHLYSEIYPYFLESLRDEPIKMFEIGIAKGASMLMWAEYFTKAKIVGLDIMLSLVDESKKLGVEGGGWECLDNRDRLDMRQGNQVDEQLLLNIMNDYDNEFDIIIDDGSHATEHQMKSFEILYKFVKPNGYYVIEDVHCDALKENGSLSIFVDKIKYNKFENTQFCGVFYTNPDSITIILKKA
jgi:cephalosporin hydroxylase|tara:strand:+ start:31869 stop:32498 length:630 start_codon:yes stop_codon:yes gene_type:complete